VIDRRTFLGAVTGGLLAAPLAAEAQQAGKVYRIGVLFEDTPGADMAGPEPRSKLLGPFLHGLHELGYMEGHNVVIERRSAEGKPERLPGLAAELVRLNVDVILASGELTTPALLAATSTIPVVQPTLTDPMERGYVKALARPGGNITGFSLRVDSAIYGKLLDLLKEVAPRISRTAVLHRTAPAGSRSSTLLEAMAPAADRLHVKLLPAVVDREDQFVAAFAAIGREHADGLIVEQNGLTSRYLRVIIQFAAKSRVPAAAGSRAFAEDGGLMSYGPNVPANFRRAATYVDKILKGANPGDLPVEQPTKFELVINLKTAKALGLTIPPSLLQRADQVIE
jgi:putative tryptophan/tyrosine transport system substrate-binding protein